MTDPQTTGVLCPKCRKPHARLVAPGDPDKAVFIFACEACGHLWTRRNLGGAADSTPRK